MGFLITKQNYIIVSARIKKLANDHRWSTDRVLVWLDDFNLVDLIETCGFSILD
jgi:hypothetical protein